LMGGEEAFGLAAVAAPGRGVEEKFHASILRWLDLAGAGVRGEGWRGCLQRNFRK
jgi:hypothetical protein